MAMKKKIIQTIAITIASSVSLFFIFPYLWMISASFRKTESILTDPLSLIPESFQLDAYRSILELSGQSLWIYFQNSVWITFASTVITVITTALGAYALFRAPKLPGFNLIRIGFLLVIL